MKKLTVWAISVAGIILLTVLSDTILPEGKTAKYIKTVTTLIAILVMLGPVPLLLSGEVSIESFFSSKNDFAIQQNYLNYTYSVAANQLEEQCEQTLNARGFFDVTVTLSVSVSKSVLSVENVSVKFNNLALNNSEANSIIEEVKTALSELLAINKSQVAVNGKG